MSKSIKTGDRVSYKTRYRGKTIESRGLVTQVEKYRFDKRKKIYLIDFGQTSEISNNIARFWWLLRESLSEE